MEVISTDPWVKNPLPYDIDDAVVKTLETHGSGAIEMALNHAQKCADFLGALVQALHDDGALTEEAVLKLLPGFRKYTGAPSEKYMGSPTDA